MVITPQLIEDLENKVHAYRPQSPINLDPWLTFTPSHNHALLKEIIKAVKEHNSEQALVAYEQLDDPHAKELIPLALLLSFFQNKLE